MSELARKLIAENKKTRNTYLDLGNCGLKELPPELGELVWLKRLILASHWRGVPGDDYGHRSKNSGGSNRALKDITLLKKLPQLQMLIANDTSISELAPLSGLSALQALHLNNTPVSNLAPLSGLLALRRLWLNSTQITDLAPLLHLIQTGRKVTANQFIGDINVHDCPLTSPPPEIVAQGNKAILNYFREREASGIDNLYEAKMLILGEGGAGKTSLLRRLYHPALPLPEEQATTKGIDIHRHDFTLANGRDFRLNVWDFGGAGDLSRHTPVLPHPPLAVCTAGRYAPQRQDRFRPRL